MSQTQGTIPLILLIGLPGSGKSTLAHHLVQAWPGTLLISTDRIRTQLFGDEAVQEPWLWVWREVGRQFRAAAQQIAQAHAGYAIYDATNVVRKQRKQALMLARQSGFSHITGVWLNPPLALCLQRNQNRDRRVPELVIAKMHRCLSGAVPSLGEDMDVLLELGPEGLVSSVSPGLSFPLL